MTKIGEGKEFPEGQNLQKIHRELDVSAEKFQNALETYQATDDTGERERLKSIMDQQLAIIHTAVSAIKKRGIYKQEVKVENDYKAYIESGSSENFTALEQDLSTLREYNELP